MNIVCLDVDYRDDHAQTGWVLFQDWTDAAPLREGRVRSEGVVAYEPGEFYRRELPALLRTLESLVEPVDGVLVDGFCWLGLHRPGLGWHLHQALAERCWVIGVAKRPFHGEPGLPVSRAGSKPLWVTACGMDQQRAADCILSMHGPFRLPTLIKRTDQLSRLT